MGGFEKFTLRCLSCLTSSYGHALYRRRELGDRHRGLERQWCVAMSPGCQSGESSGPDRGGGRGKMRLVRSIVGALGCVPPSPSESALVRNTV